jgi:catalase
MSDDQANADRTLSMAPANLPDGISAADPMLPLRNAAYSVSFRDRQ